MSTSLMIDEMKGRELADAQIDNVEKSNESFEDGLTFNAWNITPDLEAPYDQFLRKDAPLGYYIEGDLQYIEHNLNLAILLSKTTSQEHKGYYYLTNKNSDGYLIEECVEEQALASVKKLLDKDEKIIGIKKYFQTKNVFKKSIHNNYTRGITRIVLSRGRKGRASRELRSTFSERTHTLRDETRREGIFSGMFKKKPQNSERY